MKLNSLKRRVLPFVMATSAFLACSDDTRPVNDITENTRNQISDGFDFTFDLVDQGVNEEVSQDSDQEVLFDICAENDVHEFFIDLISRMQFLNELVYTRKFGIPLPGFCVSLIYQDESLDIEISAVFSSFIKTF